jgi:hypothetical protein
VVVEWDDVNKEIRCEHDNLVPDKRARRLVFSDAWERIAKAWPRSKRFPASEAPCGVCAAAKGADAAAAKEVRACVRACVRA